MMMRKADIIAHEAMIAIATTAATWMHNKVHRKLVRSFRAIAAKTAAPKAAKATSQSAET